MLRYAQTLRRGMTLLEVTLSVGVASVALLGTLASLHFGMQSTSHGALVTEANNYARQLEEVLLEENRAFSGVGLPSATSGFNDPPGQYRPLNDPPFSSAYYKLPAGSRFRRHIEVRDCRTAAESSGVYAWKDDLRQVTVIVAWDENGRSRQVTLRSTCKRPR